MKIQKKVSLAASFVVFVAVLISVMVFVKADRFYSQRPLNTSIDFRGTSVDVSCMGKGGPTVLFEPGLNESYTTFFRIQDEISKITQTFSYDRLTIAYNENGKTERSSLAEVKNLHQLLLRLRIKPPYIIVAHSIAGYNARLFAANYPGEVKGIVFVDCSHENQAFGSLPTDPTYTELTADEVYTSQVQVRVAREQDILRNTPITVLTADYADASNYELMQRFWTPLQEDIAKLSNTSRHVIVKDSGHAIQTEHPDIVIDEIKSMLKLVNVNSKSLN